MKLLSHIIDSINKCIGFIASWMTSFLVILICWDVIFRYLFKDTKIWIIEMEWHLFALIFLLGSAYALQKDKHVRVDVFYQNFSNKKKAIINLVGTIVFLLPWTMVIIKTSYNYTLNSFLINEGSPNPGGLPARYIIKAAIVLGFALLLLQGINVILKNIKILRE